MAQDGLINRGRKFNFEDVKMHYEYAVIFYSFIFIFYSFGMEQNNFAESAVESLDALQKAEKYLQRNCNPRRINRPVCKKQRNYGCRCMCFIIDEHTRRLINSAKKDPEEAVQMQANEARQQYRTHFGEEFQE